MIQTHSHQEWEKWITMFPRIDKLALTPKQTVAVIQIEAGVNQPKENQAENTTIFQMFIPKQPNLEKQKISK